MFAIMQSTTSDNPDSLRRYYGDMLPFEPTTMLPNVYANFGDAVTMARRFTAAILLCPDSEHIAEFTVLHHVDIETTFSIVQLSFTPSY